MQVRITKDIRDMTHQVIENIKQNLKEAGIVEPTVETTVWTNFIR